MLVWPWASTYSKKIETKKCIVQIYGEKICCQFATMCPPLPLVCWEYVRDQPLLYIFLPLKGFVETITLHTGTAVCSVVAVEGTPLFSFRWLIVLYRKSYTSRIDIVGTIIIIFFFFFFFNNQIFSLICSATNTNWEGGEESSHLRVSVLCPNLMTFAMQVVVGLLMNLRWSPA